MGISGRKTITVELRIALMAAGMVWLPLSAVAAGNLAAAARTADLDQSRQLIAAGADVNLPEPDGTTPLLWAVYNSSPELVQLLLDAGANPDIANRLAISPLLQASRNGDAGLIRALLASGASLSDNHPATEPALLAAARAGPRSGTSAARCWCRCQCHRAT